ncbi:MAG: MmcQ/YjbR family DNA-binding protein [Bacteroidetes bacterium]|nr:MmcQ/YjbR family DNA-binding protein [Bacteroidota bacterium]MDA1122006.1 MmcQ/YjbR family DNA-binding protein [Bacteroidota bacterium]
MNIEDFRNYCLEKAAVTEEFPFDAETLVFKVAGKIFTLTGIEDFKSINLKCDPEEAIMLRETFNAVHPGYHMNKKNWNTIDMDNTIPDILLQKWIDNSYNLVIKTLPKRTQIELSELSNLC